MNMKKSSAKHLVAKEGCFPIRHVNNESNLETNGKDD